MLAREVVQSWGSEYFHMPHGMVTVDNAGFVWATDVGP